MGGVGLLINGGGGGGGDSSVNYDYTYNII